MADEEEVLIWKEKEKTKEKSVDEEETKEEVKQSTYERLKQRAGEAATQAKEYASKKAKQAGDYAAKKAEQAEEYADKKSEQAEKYISNKLDQLEEGSIKKAEQVKKYASENLTKERIIEEAKKIPNKTYKGMQRAEETLDRNIAFDRLGEDTKYLWEQAKSSGRNIGLSEKQSARKYGDVQFPTLFGGSGGMFDVSERNRKIRQVGLHATTDEFGDPITKKYDPQTGKAIKRQFDTVQHQINAVKKNKRLVDIFEEEKRLTDYEKAERKEMMDERNILYREHLKIDTALTREELSQGIKKNKKNVDSINKKLDKENDKLKVLEQEYKDAQYFPQKMRDAQRSKISVKIRDKYNDINLLREEEAQTKQHTISSKYQLKNLAFVEEKEYSKGKEHIVTGHDPLSLFSKPKGSTSVSEEMKRLRGLQKRKPKKLVYSYDLKTRDTFDLIGSPKQRREIPYNTRPMGVSNPVSTIREPVNQLSRLTSQKIIDPFGGISVKKTKPSKAKKPIVVNVFGSLTASKRKKEPPLKKLFGGGFDLAPIKAKKAKPLKTSKKKRNVNDAFNLFGKPKKGGLF